VQLGQCAAGAPATQHSRDLQRQRRVEDEAWVKAKCWRTNLILTMTTKLIGS
jgi:hypothetical protein